MSLWLQHFARQVWSRMLQRKMVSIWSCNILISSFRWSTLSRVACTTFPVGSSSIFISRSILLALPPFCLDLASFSTYYSNRSLSRAVSNCCAYFCFSLSHSHSLAPQACQTTSDNRRVLERKINYSASSFSACELDCCLRNFSAE